MNDPINDGKHRKDLPARTEIELAEALTTMPRRILNAAYVDAIERARGNKTIGSFKAVVIIGRELKKRGENSKRFLDFQAQSEEVLEETENGS